MKDMLVKYIKLPFKYQSKIGYATLIQNVILKEIFSLVGITIVDIVIELKMKIRRTEYLESRIL